MKKVLLANSMPLSPTLPAGWTSVRVDVRQPIPPEHFDARAIVLWLPTKEHLASAAGQLTDLQLVQSLSSGMTRILTAGFRPQVAIAAGIGLHNVTVAEHTLALVLSLLRRIPESLAAQARHEWSAGLGGPQPLHPAGRITTLLDARVLIWGFGSIAQTLAPLLRSMGAHVTGVARSAGERGGFTVITRDSIRDALPHTDILIGILPADSSTHHAIDGAVLAALPHHGLVVNVGRGDTLDQRALANALAVGDLGGAAIDVTSPEPLVSGHFLWDTPNLIITPHAAGGRPVGADERIARNLSALDSGEAITHRVR